MQPEAKKKKTEKKEKPKEKSEASSSKKPSSKKSSGEVSFQVSTTFKHESSEMQITQCKQLVVINFIIILLVVQKEVRLCVGI